MRELAVLLRQNGLRVGSGELVDANRALTLVGLEERGAVKAALRSTLVKRAQDVALFDRLFELYFNGSARLFRALERSLAAALRATGRLEPKELERVVAALESLAGELSPLTQAMVDGDNGALSRLFQSAALRLELGGLPETANRSFYERRLLAGAGAAQAREELKEIASLLASKGLRAESVELVAEELAAAMRAIEAAAKEAMAFEAELRRGRVGSGSPESNGEKPIAKLSREELEETFTAVRRLAERLKSRISRRERSRRRGALNVRRTLRLNMGIGGVPARLAFKARRPSRPDVVVLCDVSDSVRNVSKLMLLFVHTLQSLFGKVRSFVFVSHVGEVTAHFKDVEAGRALELELAEMAIDLKGNSNYGQVFARFLTDHGGAISRRTTLLVIGDGRNNYNEPHRWALRELARRSRRVVWICPEPESTWGSGDSVMDGYAKECGSVAVVRTLGELASLADTLIPRGA